MQQFVLKYNNKQRYTVCENIKIIMQNCIQGFLRLFKGIFNVSNPAKWVSFF